MRRFRLQDKFVRASLERMSRLNGRYLEVVQDMMRATASAAEAGARGGLRLAAVAVGHLGPVEGPSPEGRPFPRPPGRAVWPALADGCRETRFRRFPAAKLRQGFPPALPWLSGLFSLSFAG